WPTRRNPLSDVYRVDEALAERIASWAEPEKVWLFGYWKYDWADASSPLGEFSREERTLSPKFVSLYGTKTDAPYYFFNVFEELDEAGEWYLDREKGVLYLCPPENFTENSVIDLSLTTDNVLCAQDADYLTFDGFTVKGTRGDAVNLTGNHNTLKNCLIKNVAGNAVLVTGAENTVTDNEIARTGRGGVILDGGDRDTLTPGNNRAVNNLVHDWSEIYETYQPAFTLNGVGNRCDHNEMYNSTHEAITWTGNDHLIEYNLIHDVCLLTDDGGAIYAGRRWDWYGTAIRNNLIYNLGSGEHTPVGIYLDDALSGIEVSGNVLINVPGIGLQLGGGRDLDVHDNVVVNSSRSMTYDQRAIDGVFGGWFNHAAPEGGDMWTNLYDSPWQSEAWRSAYPAMTRFSCDFDNTDDPGFVANPACSTVTHNLFVNRSGKIGEISDAAAQYSTIENNAVMKIGKLDRLFVDPANGDYTLRDDAPLDFAVAVPALSEFGRQ
ncbi:MAG: right-handed parallel beta-helix repeat-containing protein, partial [Clostridia bacterium]|nr:right-handed parallel beta-helix repeat-containing protein [Clostridia bacterium]